MEFLYCVKHEHTAVLQDSLVGKCHEYPVTTEFSWELDWCFFERGWAMSQPPENFDDGCLEGDWDTFIEEPSEEEIEVMSWE